MRPLSSILRRRPFPAFSADEVSAALGTLGITAMQNRFLALIGDEGGAAAASTFEIPAVLRAAAGDADALGSVAAEVSRAIDAGEWVAAVVDDDKEEGALFGLTRTLWLATSKGLFALEEGDGGVAAEVEGFSFVHGVIAGVLARLFMEGRVASPDMKALLHELSPIDSSEPELMDPLAADSTRIFDTVVAAYLLVPTAPSSMRHIWPIRICRWRCLRRAAQRVPARRLRRLPLARRP